MKKQKVKKLRKSDVVKSINKRKNAGLLIIFLWTALLALLFVGSGNQVGEPYSISYGESITIAIASWLFVSLYYFVNLKYSKNLNKGYKKWNKLLYIIGMIPVGLLNPSMGTLLYESNPITKAINKTMDNADLIDKYFS